MYIKILIYFYFNYNFFVQQKFLDVGDMAVEEFELGLQEGYEYSFDYDQRVEPSVINEFASAAFRFGHSTVDGILK